MKEFLVLILLVGIMFFVESCQNKKLELTDLEKSSIIDSAKVTVQKVFDASNNLKFLDGLNYYSGDSDTYYSSNGTVLTLEELKDSYRQISSSIEVMKNTIERWNATILSHNTVAFTLPVQMKIKLIGISEYSGQLIWTGIVQKRNGKWQIIQSHESWLNCAEAMSALTPLE